MPCWLTPAGHFYLGHRITIWDRGTKAGSEWPRASIGQLHGNPRFARVPFRGDQESADAPRDGVFAHGRIGKPPQFFQTRLPMGEPKFTGMLEALWNIVSHNFQSPFDAGG